MRRLFGLIAIVSFVLVLGAVLLVYSQGKRLDKNGKLSGVGLIEINTTPNEAKIYIDGEYNEQSDRNIENLKPGKYTVRLEKERYTTWEKVIEVKEGLITPLNVTLFPSNPSLTAATFDGVFSPKLSHDNKSVVFGIQTSTKAGLWVLNLDDPQLFFDNRLRQIVKDSNSIQFSNSNFSWTLDRNIFVEVQATGSTEVKYFLLKSNELNENPEGLSDGPTQKSKFATDLENRNADKLADLGDEARDLAVGATSLQFSKDNQAVIISKTDQVIVYDKKPSPVPNTKPATTSLPSMATYSWLQDQNNHIVAIENNTISILDRDGTNNVNLFSGDFDPSSVFSWQDGSRLVISINLNSKSNPLPNLYSIDLR